MNPSLPVVRDVSSVLGGPVRAIATPSTPPTPLLEVIKRHLLLIIGCMLLGSLVAMVFIHFVRPVYKSSASIRIDQQRQGPPVLDAFVKDLSATDVFTEQEALGSRALVESAADSLGLRLRVARPTQAVRSKLFSTVRVARVAPNASYRIRQSAPGKVIVENGDSAQRFGEYPDSSTIAVGGIQMRLTAAGIRALPLDIAVDGFEEAVQRIRKKVQVVRPNRDANIIVLEYRGDDPALVRDVPNVIVANFLATRRAAQKSVARSTVAFLRAELDTVSDQLASTEASFGTFRTTNQVVDLTAEADGRVRHLGELEAQRNQLEADRVALKHVLDAIGSNSDDDVRLFAARIVGYPTLFKNQAVSELLHALTDAANRRADLLRHRTTRDPDVRAETQRISDLAQQLRAIATTYLEGLTQQVSALDAERSSFGKALSTIPQRQIENTQWQRRQTLLEGVVAQLQTRLHDAQIAEAVDDPSVRMVDAAILPLAPYFPKAIVVLPAAIFCGLFGGLLIAWIIESKDVTIHTRGQLGAISGLPVLAAVPRSRQRSWRLGRRVAMPAMSLTAGKNGWDPGDEAYRSLRTNIDVLRERGAQAILVTSPSQGDGKTRTATNLAVSLARQGSRVLLIDADLRRGTISSIFLLPSRPGLAELLRGDVEYEQCVHALRFQEHIQLDIIGAGAAAPDAAELLQQRRCRDLIASLRATYDFIVIDTPPLNVVTDAAIVSPLCDGILLVARAGVTTPTALSHAMEQLHLAGGTDILGTVLNDIDASVEARAYGATY